jgi:hypothetical protein
MMHPPFFHLQRLIAPQIGLLLGRLLRKICNNPVVEQWPYQEEATENRQVAAISPGQTVSKKWRYGEKLPVAGKRGAK